MFFLEDLSYRFLTVPGGKCDFAWISALGCRGFPRARAPVSVVREHDLGCWERIFACPGARIRLSGSTNSVVQEHDLALPARLSGSTSQVVWEHD